MTIPEAQTSLSLEIYEKVEEIKNEIISRDNNLVYMKFKSLLDIFGYKRRSRQFVDELSACLAKNNIYILHNGEKVDLFEVPYDEYINLKYMEIKEDERHFYYENAGKIKVSPGKNPINLFYHQLEAIHQLNNINQQRSFSGLLAIPTGGGKTLTAIWWLLKNVVNKRKKVLWIAHRHELLSQAFIALKDNAYSDLLNDRKEFSYRIISGQHDRCASQGVFGRKSFEIP